MKLPSHARLYTLVAVAPLLSACVDPVVAPQTSTPPAAKLSFARGPCLGKCPDYQFEVAASGDYHLSSTPTPTPTPQKGNLNATIMQKLQSLYRQVNALKLPERLTGTDVCPHFMTDMPSVTLQWRTASRHWQLNHNLGCKDFAGEEQLLALEAQIEKLLPKISDRVEQ